MHAFVFGRIFFHGLNRFDLDVIADVVLGFEVLVQLILEVRLEVVLGLGLVLVGLDWVVFRLRLVVFHLGLSFPLLVLIGFDDGVAEFDPSFLGGIELIEGATFGQFVVLVGDGGAIEGLVIGGDVASAP